MTAPHSASHSAAGAARSLLPPGRDLLRARASLARRLHRERAPQPIGVRGTFLIPGLLRHGSSVPCTANRRRQLWDTNAHLALDYERGRSARVGYLTNQPRTIGVGARYKF